MGRSAFIREIIVFLLLPRSGSAQGAGEYVYIPDAEEVRTARISGFRIYLVEENGVRLRHDSLQQVYLFDWGPDDEVVKVVRFEYDYRPTPGAGMD